MIDTVEQWLLEVQEQEETLRYHSRYIVEKRRTSTGGYRVLVKEQGVVVRDVKSISLDSALKNCLDWIGDDDYYVEWAKED